MAYLFGGIALDTDIGLEHLECPAGRVLRAHIRLDRVAEPATRERILHRSDGRYRLSLGRVIAADAREGSAGGGTGDWVFRSRFPDAFTFSPSRQRIACHIVSDDDQTWQDVLFRRVLPRIATTYGAMAIHAAAIATPDRCLLLLGRSGAGKSTLTAFCAQAGWRVLSDDIALAWNDATATMVEPVQRGMGVWDATREGLALPAGRLAPMPGYENRKWWFRPKHFPSAEARALSGIVILERSATVSAPQADPVTTQDALRALMAQTIPFLPEDGPSAATATSFGRIALLARRVPCHRLTYPDGYGRLAETEAMLRQMPIDGSRR